MAFASFFPMIPSVEALLFLGALFLLGMKLTALRRTVQTSREGETFVRSTLDALPQHIAILDEKGIILTVNSAWRAHAEKNSPTPESLCEGANYLAACHVPGRNGHQEGLAFSEGIRGVMRGALLEFSLEYPWQGADGCRWFMGKITPLPGRGATRVVISHDDITELKQAEQAIEQLAYHDPLTGLPNRLQLHDLLGQIIAHASRERRLVGLLFLDLDRFKAINDTLGHSAGDQLLKTVSARLRECGRRSDTLARLGGDEFLMVLSSVNHTEDAAHLARKMIDTIARPMVLDGHPVTISTSIGISVYPTDGEDADTLIRCADMAMYRAKEAGAGNYRFFSTEMNSRALQMAALETELRQALEHGEFRLHYQHQIDLASGRIRGIETLLRWQHPERGLLPPAEFLAVAEESGLIVPIGYWVLRTACVQLKRWQNEGISGQRIAVNLSARQLCHPNLLRKTGEILAETGLDPGSLEFECAESSLQGASPQTLDTLRALGRMGVHLAIDNFGSGFSSLRQLQSIAVDRLKIDLSLIRQIPGDGNATRVVEAIIALARTLGIKVVAEGVEGEEQLAALQLRRCDLGQGFLCGRPLPPEDFGRSLKEQKRNKEALPSLQGLFRGGWTSLADGDGGVSKGLPGSPARHRTTADAAGQPPAPLRPG